MQDCLIQNTFWSVVGFRFPSPKHRVGVIQASRLSYGGSLSVSSDRIKLEKLDFTKFSVLSQIHSGISVSVSHQGRV